MQIFLDGLVILGKYAGALAVLVIGSLGMGVWTTRLIQGKEYRHFGLFLALSLCIGVIPLACLAMTAVILGRLLPGVLPIGMTAVTLIGAGGLIAWLWLDRPWPKNLPGRLWLAGGGIAFLLLLVIRLAFLRGLLLPPYSDGAVHYLVVRDFLQPGSAPALTHSLGNIFKQYYHFGFHSLTAWLAWLTGIPPQVLLPLLGQWFICLTALAVLCSVVLTSSNWPAGLFAAMLAALAWRMPAFAANWAKYPALSGLAVFPAVLALLGTLSPDRQRRWALFGTATLAGGMLVLHARLAILLALAGLCLLLVLGLDRWMGGKSRPWLAAGALLGMAILFALQKDLVWVYGGVTLLPLALVTILLPGAVLQFPRLTSGVALFAAALIVALWLPVPEALQFYGAATWIDKPFLILCFYLPLSVLGGLGAAGLWRIIASRKFWQAMLVLLVAETAIGGLWTGGTFFPSSCCNYVEESDLQAVEWIDQNLPEEATIIAAGFLIPKSIMSTDAGVWPGALTGRPTLILPYDYAWDDPAALQQICIQGGGYIYADNQNYSFIRERLGQADWYQPVYGQGNEAIYRISACDLPDENIPNR